MITCPNCGRLDKDDVLIYNESINLRLFNLFPVHPICRHCMTEVNIEYSCSGGNIVAITETCGSGKSTVAEKLTEKDFLAIDGDNISQLVKSKLNLDKIEFNSEEIFNEIAYEIDVLSLITDKFILSHIFVPVETAM